MTRVSGSHHTTQTINLIQELRVVGYVYDPPARIQHSLIALDDEHISGDIPFLILCAKPSASVQVCSVRSQSKIMVLFFSVSAGTTEKAVGGQQLEIQRKAQTSSTRSARGL